MDNMNNSTNVEEKIPVGRRLRQLTEAAKSLREVTALINILEEAANQGQDRVTFDDLRTVVPNMIVNGTIWDWLKDNEINATGSVDQNTAQYRYTLFW